MRAKSLRIRERFASACDSPDFFTAPELASRGPVSRLPALLVVAADRRELRYLPSMPEGFAPLDIGLRWSALGALGGRSALLVAHGAGRDNARFAARRACERFPVQAIVSTGWAGALDPALRVGDIVVPDRILEFAGRVEYPVGLSECIWEGGASGERARPVSGTLLTADEVVLDSAGKASLRETGASIVDMEASAVAAVAAARGLPFYCVRVVSDTAETNFAIDFNRARRADGTFSGWKILRQAGISPARWKHLMTLRRDARKASRILGDFLGRRRFGNENS